VVVDRPDRVGRKRILDVHSRGKPVSADVDLEALAGQTPGFTGADLANLVNEAALLAARRNHEAVTESDFADALEKILSWKDVDEMFELAHFVGVTRPGFELSDAHLPEDVVSLVTVPAMAISSTDCRARVAAGQPVWYLVPDGVVQYIAKRHLYR